MNHRAYLVGQLARAHQVLLDQGASSEKRRGARCRINRTQRQLRRLAPMPRMKRGLQIDLVPQKYRHLAVRSAA